MAGKNTLQVTLLTPVEIAADEQRDLDRINDEFKQAFAFLKKYPKSVSIFGSTRFTPENEHFKDARLLASKIAAKGYAIITGGGPGIMQAANQGAKESGGASVGISIALQKEQETNEYVTDTVTFQYFFTRKTVLSFAAEAYVFFPGGFGTLDEFFEILTLVQTNKIPRVPIVLVGRDYWGALDEFILVNVEKRHRAIRPEERLLYTILDDHAEILKLIESAPVQNWWKNFSVDSS